MLEMFAYPSGDIHMGHFRNYIIGDAVARWKMMQGKEVLHPFGWDAFGLPAERAAIQRGIHPKDWTLSNIKVSRETLQRVGISYDWDREVISSEPDYYKWTQWMFIQLLKKGLAFRKHGYVNWCPEDKTVLANEQVKDGKCERCGTAVEKKEQEGWYFRITDYADRLIDDLDKLPFWPDNLKSMQREWIGRSYGAQIEFKLEDGKTKLPVFTTRPDTIFGVTFMAISPESELVKSLDLKAPYKEKVEEYRHKALSKTDMERAAATLDKDGVFTGSYAINPFNNEKVQLWVADYVLAGYGTGAVMGVPGHDTRDFAFAKRYGIPVKLVIQAPENHSANEAFCEYGEMINSGQFNGLKGSEAIAAVTKFAEERGIGKKQKQFKLRDWSISRQRYWGCPIPVIHCKKCGIVEVPEKDLPVLLPKVENFMPKGRSPLADVPEFMNVTCPKCRGEAQRDPDTMDTFVCSSWYYLRYLDAHNDKAPFDKKTDSWMPIDLYVGGITHATGHLIYFRFFQKFLKDIGWTKYEEPVVRMFNHGMVADVHGEIMSKSKGNVVSPVDLMNERGVDISRLGMYFTAPSEREVLWSNDTLTGVEKFVVIKLYTLLEKMTDTNLDLKKHFKKSELTKKDWSLYIKLNQTIKRVEDSYEQLQFNTAIAALMELVRDFDQSKPELNQLNDYIIAKVTQLIAPMTPHVAEEMWEQFGADSSIFKSEWPIYDRNAVVGDTIEIAVQVNGKLRDSVTVGAGANQEDVEIVAFESAKVLAFTDNKQIVKKIYVPGRILNIVVK
jgi:leucyl-tRNA synthetase